MKFIKSKMTLSFKTMVLIGSMLLVMAILLFLFTDRTLKAILDNSQREVYLSKVIDIRNTLKIKNQRLIKTQMVENYRDSFQQSAIKELRKYYSEKSATQLYPAILDTRGMVVLHPQLPYGDTTYRNASFIQEIVKKRSGELDFTFQEIKKWAIFIEFPEWNWIIVYAVPYKIKYADLYIFRQNFAVIVLFVLFVVMSTLFFLVRKLTLPIMKLTQASAAMAEGEDVEELRSASNDEIGTLTNTFIQMRNEIKEQFSKIYKSEENLRITLNSIGDGIIATDANGLIKQMNPVAEELTGWKFDNVVGKPLTKIFKTFHPKTRESVVDPTEKALSSGKIIKLSNQTTLVSRNGTEYQIADSAAPIHNDKGEVIGVVLVFRDVTDEYVLQEQLRTKAFLVESASSPIIMSTLEGNLSYANRAFLETWGYNTQEQVLGRSIADFWVVDGPLSKLLTLMKEKGSIVGEKQARRRYGTLFDVQVSAAMVYNDEGKPIAMMASSQDLTARKNAEKALKESSSMLQMVMNNIPQFIFWKDLNFRYLGCNQNFAQIAGYKSSEELIGKTDYDMVWKKEESDFFRTCDERVMKSGKGEYHIIEPQLQADGKEAWLDTNKMPLLDGDGKVVGVLGTFEDITERKQSEEEVRHLRNYLSNIINSMPSTLVGVDTQGKVTQWNKTAEKVTGVTADVAQGKTLSDVFPHMITEMEKITKSIKTCQATQEQKKVKRENGATEYEDITIYPLVSNGVEGAVIRIDDVTEKVRMEEIMIQSEKMLSVGGLAAGMAHEINNPLAGMMQTASVLSSRLTDDLPINERAANEAGTTMEVIRAFMEARSIPAMLGRIKSSGVRASEIVSNMLSFARKSDSTFSSHCLVPLLNQSVELAGSDYDLKKKYDFRQISIFREYEENLPLVCCEGGKIQQVFLNLLRNGAEAMQEGNSNSEKPCFILRLAYEKDSNMVRIEIEDNGPGMSETVSKRVFEPFFTTKTTDQGTGLGLSVSYFIITENHKGEMSVESTQNKGTTFIIRLPVERN